MDIHNMFIKYKCWMLPGLRVGAASGMARVMGRPDQSAGGSTLLACPAAAWVFASGCYQGGVVQVGAS